MPYATSHSSPRFLSGSSGHDQAVSRGCPDQLVKPQLLPPTLLLFSCSSPITRRYPDRARVPFQLILFSVSRVIFRFFKASRSCLSHSALSLINRSSASFFLSSSSLRVAARRGRTCKHLSVLECQRLAITHLGVELPPRPVFQRPINTRI